MRGGRALAAAIAGALLAAAGQATDPPAEAPAQQAPPAVAPIPDPFWFAATQVFPRSDAGWDEAAEVSLRQASDRANEYAARVQAAKQGGTLRGAGGVATALGRVGSYSGILGAYSGGDHAGMAQEATNALLGDLATAAGAALAVALLPATASVATIAAVGVAGAVVFSAGYDWLVKPYVDAGFDQGVELGQDLAATEQRIERARIWVAEARTACGDARRWLAEARRGGRDVGAAEETLRWLTEESATGERRIANACELAARARESADPAEVAAESVESARRAEGLATDAAGYADEACRIADEMAATRQPDALRIWNRADRYVDERARAVTSRAAEAVEAARDAAARVAEIDELRRAAAAAAAGATADVAVLAADVAGGRARLDQVAGEVRRGTVWSQRAAAAAEECHGLRGKAIALLDKPPWNASLAVQSVLQIDVLPIDPPFAEIEAFADALPEDEAAVARATRRVEEIAARVAELQRDLATNLPAPDAAAAERARGAVARAEEAQDAAARAAARTEGCAERARAIAGAAPEGDEPPTANGWERVGSVETVGSAAVPAAPAATAESAAPALEDLLGDAETAFGLCDFAAARAAIAQARRHFPGDPYVEEVAARIEAKAERQAAAIAALQSAEQALARGARKEAVAALDRAADVAPDCFTRQVSAVSRGVRDGLATQRADADERARAAIGGMLGSLVGAMNAATAAAGDGTGPAAGAGPGVYPGAGGSATGGAPGGGATGSDCWIGGASDAAELYLLLRQRPRPNVTNYVIVPTSRKHAAAAASGTGMELVSRHESYADALAAARRACASPAAGSR